MSLFSVTKVEMVQDGEFVISMSLFSVTKMEMDYMFDSECPPAAGS